MSTFDESVDELDRPYRRVKFWYGCTIVFGSVRPVRAVIDTGDGEWGPEVHTWHHVHHLRLRHGLVASTLRRVAEHLPAPAARLLKSWFPGPFLPTDLIIKQQKPDWEAEFDNEIKVYQRLAPLQGSVVPVLFGTVTFEGHRALLLSDVGGKPLASVGYDMVSRDTLRDLLIASLRPICEMGIYPYDTNLANCHLVAGNKIMIVDHEQDEDLETVDREELEEQVEGKADAIMANHWRIHKPPTPPMDPAALRAASELSQARNRAALRIGSAMPGGQWLGWNNTIGAPSAVRTGVNLQG